MIENRSGLTESYERQIRHPRLEITDVPARNDSRWPDGNPAGAIELSDAELQAALNAAPICSKYASISTTWCDNPEVC